MPGHSIDTADYRLLPTEKTFGQLLLPFASPYFTYVALGSIPSGILPKAISGSLRLVAVLGLLWIFRKNYRLGPALKAGQVLTALVAGIVATAFWILALRFSLALPFWRGHLEAALLLEPNHLEWALRALGSALLVPVFEELFCRGYLGEFFHRASQGEGSLSSRLANSWDHYPQPLAGPPMSFLSVAGSTVVFTIGHDLPSWAAAAGYFLFTSWIYKRTRSFRVCIIMHAIANITIALLVLWQPGMRFLW